MSGCGDAFEVAVASFPVVVVKPVVFAADHGEVVQRGCAAVFVGDWVVRLSAIGGAFTAGPGADGVVDEHRDALLFSRQAGVADGK